MRTANIFVNSGLAGKLYEINKGNKYKFVYEKDYKGKPISLTMPAIDVEYEFSSFPPFFDGLLPEGVQLASLLKLKKIDRLDFFSQLVAVGQDLVGTIRVEEV